MNPGAELEARYALGGELGRGGFGVVYRGVRRSDGVEVAIKFHRSGVLAGARERVRREAALLARLSIPGLVPILDVVDDPEGLALVYPLVAGVPIGARVAARRPGPAEVAAWVASLGESLDALHREGCVHRDVKPENILVDDSGRPVLIDYGLLREVEGGTLTASGLVVGTPSFMAPEALRGERATPAWDLWGLAATAYFGLTGRVPFEGEAPLPILAAAGATRFRSLVEVEDAYREPLRSWFATAFAAEPARRFRTGAAMARALDRALADPAKIPAAEAATRVVAAPPVRGPATPPVRGRPRTSRTGVFASVALLGAVGLLAAALALLAPLPQEPGGQFRDPDPQAGTTGGPDPTTGSGTAFESDGPGRTPPLPVPDQGVLDAARDQLANAQGLWVDRADRLLPPGTEASVPPEHRRPLLCGDPLLWLRVLEAMPALDRLSAWVARGGRAGDLSPGVLAGLLDLDARLAAEGLPRSLGLLSPWQEPRAPGGEGEPEDSGEDLGAGASGGQRSDSRSRWFRLARLRLGEAKAGMERKRLALEAGGPGIPEEIVTLSASSAELLSARNLRRLVASGFRFPWLRTALARWLAPEIDAFSVSLQALARALARSPEARAWAAEELWDGELESAMVLLRSHLAVLPLERILGTPLPEDLAGLALRFTLVRHRRWALSIREDDPVSQEEGFAEEFELGNRILASRPDTPELQAVWNQTWERLAGTHLAVGDLAGIAELDRLRARVQGPGAQKAQAWMDMRLALALAGTGEPMGLTPERIRRLAASALSDPKLASHFREAELPVTEDRRPTFGLRTPGELASRLRHLADRAEAAGASGADATAGAPGR